MESTGGTDISAVGELPGADEDIVVDTLESGAGTTGIGEFEITPGKLLGIDQAVLQSIERCRKFLIMYLSYCMWMLSQNK